VPLNEEMKKLLEQRGISGISDPPGKIKIYVENESDLLKLPQEINIAGVSVPVQGIVSGRFLALQLDRKSMLRPAPGGCSIGHYQITAGTLGSRVFDSMTRKRLILSNNHVLGNSNLGKIGDPIYQPGSVDGGMSSSTIATLERFVTIIPEENLVDAALANPLNDADLSDEILDIGIVTNVKECSVGQTVAKSGRTSGYSEGGITDIYATIKVYGYPFPDEYAIFKDQVIVSPAIGQPGDSGSLVVDADDKSSAVGLLFAGSDTLTAVNKITNVCNLLNIDFSSALPPSPPASRSNIMIAALPFIFAVPAFLFKPKKR